MVKPGKIFSYIIFILLLAPAPERVFCQEDDIYEMSLEDLLNMEVTTASRRAEQISDAPAIVTVLKGSRIRELGVQSLPELMSYVPGFSVSDTYWKPGIITARGVTMTLYNDKTLMLINGVPAYDAMMEHYLDAVPVNAVNRIEIIRGPGSALYGTNAFSAVINIITEEPGSTAGGTASIKLGSFDTREAAASFGGTAGALDYFVAARMRDDDGYLRRATDEAGVSGDIQYEKDNHAFYAGISCGEISLNAGCLFQRFGKFGPIPVFMAGNQLHRDAGKADHRKYYLNLVHNLEPNDKLRISSTVHFDYIDKYSDIGSYAYEFGYHQLGIIDSTVPPDFYRFGGTVIQGDLRVNYYHSRLVHILGGITGERRRIDNMATIYTDRGGDELYEGSTTHLPIDMDDFCGYIQMDGVRGRLGYIAGLRYSYLGISRDGYITPRAGITFRIQPKTSLKFLYGEAFRGAAPQEQYYRVDGIIYGADRVGISLKPERIRTYELGLDRALGSRHNLRINGFYTEVFDLIGRREPKEEETATVGSARIYDNLGDKQLYGCEIEIAGYPSNRFNYFGNLSLKDGTDGGTGEDIEFIEHITANAGFSWNPFSGMAFIPNAQYVGSRSGKNLAGDDIEVAPYLLIHCSGILKAGENLKVSVIIRNLLDEEYAYPEMIRRRGVSTAHGGPMTIPGGPGRALYVGISRNF